MCACTPTDDPGGAVGRAVRFAGALCLDRRIWPPHPGSPSGLLLALAAIGLTGGAVSGARHPHPLVAIHAAWLGGVLSGSWPGDSVSTVGIVGLGPVLIAIGLYAAYFFPLGVARLHVLVLVALRRPGRSLPPPADSRCPGWCSSRPPPPSPRRRGGLRGACAPRPRPIR